ncbi:methyltransferase domain-containing protein [Streptomyces sp. 8K308]|uniref:methyltransferase domain-containing protein n=1 Tax=Streptomyces sp. 8K308 TaxID=2530388 RepID=UPI001052178E|nr:methyltransferase domain-containing protein [Streptomyces sp. 8K308]TDC20792.1 methyltransferase domain-containing protein [Streptomyces sp. 8K308]
MDSLIGYVHGYSEREARRLGDQADTLARLLHAGTTYPPGSRVLEAGCGVGAQTVHLVANSPGVRWVALDRSAESLATARARVTAASPEAEIRWCHADVYELPFADEEFDHVFVCFLLEHLSNRQRALAELRRVLRPGGSLTVIEGDHGTAFFHPDSPYARAVIECQVRLQRMAGGDAHTGRAVGPLLRGAGFEDVSVEVRTVYADDARPDLMADFVLDTFAAMIGGVREQALEADLMTPSDWERGMADLYRTAGVDGTFHYAFFKGVGVRPD